MKKYYLLFALFVAATITAQSPATPDLNFSIPGAPANYYNYDYKNFDAFSPEMVRALVQPDGKIIINSGSGLERVDGNVKDLTFNVAFEGEEYSPEYYTLSDMLLQPDGKVIVSGNFTKCNGTAVKKLIRLLPNGAIDTSFDIAFTPEAVGAMALQSDGKIIVCVVSEVNFSWVLKRLNADGSDDPSFNFPEDANIYYYKFFELLPDGKMMFQSGDLQVKRLNSDGSYDTGFHLATPETNSYFRCFKMQPDGKIIVGGGFTTYDGIAAPGIVRLNSDGTVDTGFSATGDGQPLNILTAVNDVAILPSGEIVLAINGTSFVSGTTVNNGSIIKLDGSGAFETTFLPNIQGDGDVVSNAAFVTLLPDSKLLVQRIVNTTADIQFDGVLKLNADGSRDTTFNNGPGFSHTVNAILPLPDNKILVGGSFADFNGSHQKNLVRLNEDGTLDATFNTGNSFNRTVDVMALQPDGKILLASGFIAFGGTVTSGIIRLNSDGTLDPSFQLQTQFYNISVLSILVQPDGKILLGGFFYITQGNQTWHHIIRLNTNGTIDTTFDNGPLTSFGFNGTVRAMALQADGKILVGGDFTGQVNCVGCTADKKVVRLNTDGTFDDSFSYSLNNSIYAIALEESGNILIGGAFTIDSHLIRVTPTGGTIGFGSPFQVNNNVYTIMVQPDGKIVFGGKFNGIENANVKGLARVFPNGNLDPDFNTGTGFNGEVKSVAMQANGRILAGGSFTRYNGSLARRMIGLTGDDFYVMRGSNKLDIDNNGCDVADLIFPFLKFNVSNGSVNIPNASGSYSFSVGAGTYIFTPQFENPSYFTASPSSVTIDFPSTTNPFTQNFCIVPNGSHQDLEVNLLPVTVARPGFNATYKLVYKNKGNQAQSGSILLTFNDAIADVVSATPAAASTSDGELTWNFSNLNPFETREITFVLNLNSPSESPSVNSGDIVNLTALVSTSGTDEIPADNTFTLNQTVVNAFDPNDKTCLEGKSIPVEKVGEYVHYMIRFENTGNYPAENVIVSDMIDTDKFDIATLTPISASHLFTTRISNGKAEFVFESINLPFDDANNDGYVAFKIKTKPTLSEGDTFSNSAAIFFDYNTPIVTEPAATFIGTLSRPDFTFANYFNVYPNPAGGILNIHKKQEIAVTSVSVYNTLGQLVLVVANAQDVNSIDVSGLKTGNYFMKINSDKGISNTKFIKM